jgi:hypothetical protein
LEMGIVPSWPPRSMWVFVNLSTPKSGRG